MKILLTIILLFMVGCTSLPNSQKIETEQASFTYYLAGQSKPTVIFESGLGDDMTTWEAIINQVEKNSQVFAYNRAGFSGSKSKNVKRSGQVIINELRDLLKKTKLSPPYILVGHSLGGTYMELYAKTYPEEVSGVVLVDPYPSKYPERCVIEKLNYCKPPSSMPYWASLILPPAIEGEIKGFADTLEQVNAVESFPEVPLVVLSATTYENPKSDIQKRHNIVDVELKRDLSTISPISKHIICAACSHYIHEDDPALVINAIKWVVDNHNSK